MVNLNSDTMLFDGNQSYFNLDAKGNASMDHYTANVITTTIGGGLSMVAGMFIFISYIKLDYLRSGGTNAEKILLCIIMADFAAAGSSVIGVLRPDLGTGCKAEGFFIIFSTTASFFWTTSLTIHLFLITVNKSSAVEMICFHVVSWGLPLLLSFVALGSDALGPSPNLRSSKYIKLTTGGWCWIKQFPDKTTTVVWTLMTSKIWEIVSYLIITVLCMLILCQLHFRLKSSVDVGSDTLSAARNVKRRMMIIPIAFILFRIWGTVRYFAYVSSFPIRQDVLENITLYAFQGLGDSSQGLANSIFFCLSNKRVYYYWKAVLFKQCYYCCHREESNEHTRLLVPPKSLQLQGN